jgi:hypothetical protein
MIQVWRALTILFFVSIPLWYIPVIITDLMHPELWDKDWMHDPRIYLPMLGVVGVLGLLMAAHISWTERRKR